METWLQDLRYGVRMLRKSPGFTAVAVITLALGIGANLAVFGLLDELWLRPRPVPHPEQIVRLFTSNPSSEGEVARGLTSYPDFLDLEQRSKTLAGVALLDRRGAMLEIGGRDKLITAAVVSSNFFDVLQPIPARGRIFTSSEMRSPGVRVVMISYPFWQQQFNGDPELPGRTINLNHQQVEVTGVLPRGFRGAESGQVPNVWFPINTWTVLIGEHFHRGRGERRYDVFARLRPNVSVQQANAETGAIAAALAREFPATNKGRQMMVLPEREAADTAVQELTTVLFAISGLVLLIACANVAGLMLARTEYRRSELAMRVAMGANRTRLLRQMLTETALLGAAATAAAVFLGSNLLQVLPKLLPHASFSAAIDAHVDGRVLIFAVAAALAAMLGAGMTPAWQASATAPGTVLKRHAGARGTSRAMARTALTVAQVAVSLVLVVSAGLLTRSLLKAQSANPGFDAHQNMLVLELGPSASNNQQLHQFVAESRRRLESLPGVLGTAVGLRVPFGLSGGGATSKVFLPNASGAAVVEGIPIHENPVSDHYFEVMGTRLLRGRGIDTHDFQTGAHVLVINQTMAQRFWPGQNPIGRQVRLDKPDGELYEVIGVAENSKNDEFAEDPMPYMYRPWPGDGEFAMAVKTAADPATFAATVRRTLMDTDKNLEIIYLATLREHMRLAMNEQRIAARLIVALSSLGLLLAAVGLYGLTAFLVGRRIPEIGIRMALGAQRSAVFRLVVQRALVMTVAGIGAGMVAAIPVSRALRSFLFGVQQHDPLTFVLAVAVLSAVAGAAALVPALRATRVDPLAALRYE